MGSIPAAGSKVNSLLKSVLNLSKQKGREGLTPKTKRINLKTNFKKYNCSFPSPWRRWPTTG